MANAIMMGSILGNLVDFVIIAFVVFTITKALLKPAPAPPAAPTKSCPECLELIPAAARKCKAWRERGLSSADSPAAGG